MKIVLNPAPIHPIGDGLLRKVDVITPNEVEAAALSGVPIRPQMTLSAPLRP